MHPAPGITLYIREITPAGELIDLFIADERAQGERLIHSAQKAFLVRGDVAPKLVMLDGSTQRLQRDSTRLSVTRFADFTLDMAGMVQAGGMGQVPMNALPTMELLAAAPEHQSALGVSAAQMLEEGHSRLAAPLLGVAAPLIGFAALMLGGFSRFGLWRQMALAVGLIIGIQLVWTWTSGMAIQTAGGWALLYFAPVLGVLVAACLLLVAQMPRRLGRASA
jgi:lipopolysaccharide export system permease protein